MPDKFILVRKRKQYIQNDKHPKVHVTAETYTKVAEWAGETGLRMSELLGMAVEFADKHSIFVDE